VQAAEARGKKHVYDKVKAQFDQGNREFVKVSQQYIYTNTHAHTHEHALTQTRIHIYTYTITQLRAQLKSTQEELDALRVTHASVLASSADQANALAAAHKQHEADAAAIAAMTAECDRLREEGREGREQLAAMEARVEEGGRELGRREEEVKAKEAALMTAMKELAELQVHPHNTLISNCLQCNLISLLLPLPPFPPSLRSVP